MIMLVPGFEMEVGNPWRRRPVEDVNLTVAATADAVNEDFNKSYSHRQEMERGECGWHRYYNSTNKDTLSPFPYRTVRQHVAP